MPLCQSGVDFCVGGQNAVSSGTVNAMLGGSQTFDRDKGGNQVQ